MLKSLNQFFKTKILRNGQARWNQQYQSGKWEGLKDELELERQEICRHFIKQYKPGGSILEIGCGEGIFIKNVIKNDEFSQYLGIDISDFVINKANLELASRRIHFLQDDMDNFKLQKQFDIIFFNESLNYSKNITKTLNYCLENLCEPDAIFIISLHRHKHSVKHWAEIHGLLDKIDSKYHKNERAEWNIEVLR